MFLDGASLARRIAALRAAGVTVRKDYPPDNIDKGFPHLPAVDAEVRTAELLTARNDPRKLSIPTPPPQGDIDVLLQAGTKVGFEVKNFELLGVDQAGTPNNLYREALTARAMILQDLRRHPNRGTHTQVSLSRTPDKVARMTGAIEPRPFAQPLHHVEVRIPWEAYARPTSGKIRKAVKESVAQLEEAGASIVVPVLGFLGYPIDEIWAFDFIRAQLAQSDGYWGRADAVCLLTYEPVATPFLGLFGQVPRLVPIANPQRQGFDTQWVAEGTEVRLYDGAEVSLSGFYGPNGEPRLTTTEYRDGITYVDGVPLARVVDDPALRGMAFFGVPGPLRGHPPKFDLTTKRPRRGVD